MTQTEITKLHNLHRVMTQAGVPGRRFTDHKIAPAAHVAPEYTSSEWIAHNAAMRAKRPLLGQGKRPVIGSAWRPRPTITPAVFMVHRARRWRVIRDALMLACTVAVIGFIAFAGLAVGLS